MNVCGFASFVRTPSISPRPTSELHSRRPTTIPSSWANLSININPRLCRVHSYSFPGLPKPTISMTCRKKAQNAQNKTSKTDCVTFVPSCGLFCFLALFFLLALANHFGFGRLFTFSRRRRSSLFLHDTDSGNNLFGIRQNLECFTNRNVRHVQN